jgi:tRNA-dihydrouridine synthase C
MIKLILAPMQGLIDPYMRRVLTDIGGYDWCVSEFIRVTQGLHPKRVILRHVPELLRGCKTAAGTPVFVQLLGNNPILMAENAQLAAEMGAYGIDLNFGCPSKPVNTKGAGAALLDDPQTIYRIAATTRAALEPAIPLTAKIRLGNADTSQFYEVINALESAGVSLITLHARIKKDNYNAPARWEWFQKAREATSLPLVANGDIVDVESFKQVQALSGFDHFMLARGAIASPYLAQMIRGQLNLQLIKPHSWSLQRQHLLKLVELMVDNGEEDTKAIQPRLKQWLSMMQYTVPEAARLFDQIKREKSLVVITQAIIAS